MERVIQGVVTNIIKWTPSGAGIALMAHSFISQQWLQGILLTFLTACSSLWVKFSGGFMQEAEKEAEKKGGSLAQWLSALVDQVIAIIQRELTQFWWNRTSNFQKHYYQRLEFTCRDFLTQGLDKDRILKLYKVFVPLKIVAKETVRVSSDMVPRVGSSVNSSEQKEIGDFLVAMQSDRAFPRLAILGAPGSGKTTLLRYLTLIYATDNHQRLHPKAPKLIPILLSLRDIYPDIVKENPLPLAELITTQVIRLQPDAPLQPPPGWFADKLRQNQCLVMLDGLDEVADELQRQQVSRWVDQQIEAYPDTAFVLTSRPFGYRNAQLQQAVTVLEVQPFTLTQMQQFLHRWYLETEVMSRAGENDLGVQNEARQQADDLIERIRNSPPLAAMAVNPLLLTMIAVVHRRGSALPGKRVELYKEICQVLLEKRQLAKKIPDSLSAAQKQSVLQGIALWLMQGETRKFTLSEVRSLVEERLRLVCRDEAEPEQFLQQIRNVSGLFIAKEQEGIYEFAHLSFQEYLTAVEIKDSAQERWLIDAFQHAEKLSWWAETIRLYAAQADASNLIRAALQNCNVSALSLAFDCLEEGKSVDPGMRQQLEVILEAGLEDPMTELFNLAAQVKLSRRLNRLLRVDETVEIDMSYITCAEYQLFIDYKRTLGEFVQPDHWQTERFPDGESQTPITGVRASDAVAFCEWLSQQPVAVGFRYRLPSLAEVNEYPVAERGVGCWCQDNDRIVIAGIEPKQWQLWHQEFVNLLNSDLARALARARDLALDLARDLARALARALDHDRARTLDLDLDLARTLARALDLDRDLTRTLARDLDLALDRDRDRTRDLALDLALARARDLDLTLDRDLARNLALARDLDLARTRARDCDLALARDLDRTLARDRDRDRALDYKFVHFYLLLISVMWRLLADVYDRATKNRQVLRVSSLSSQNCEEISRECAAKQDEVLRLYTFFVLIEERHQGNMPAWEGIRIVRERIAD